MKFFRPPEFSRLPRDPLKKMERCPQHPRIPSMWSLETAADRMVVSKPCLKIPQKMTKVKMAIAKTKLALPRHSLKRRIRNLLMSLIRVAKVWPYKSNDQTQLAINQLRIRLARRSAVLFQSLTFSAARKHKSSQVNRLSHHSPKPKRLKKLAAL